MNGHAVISPCGKYRYVLTRQIQTTLPLPGEPILFVMLNPSTADASIDDPTIRRCMGFARAWGRNGICVANLFAIRSTDPAGIAAASDPVGPENNAWLQRLASQCKDVVCAWGSHKQAAHRQRYVRDIMLDAGAQIWCLGTTKDGSPRHPLYVPNSQQLERWPQ